MTVYTKDGIMYNIVTDNLSFDNNKHMSYGLMIHRLGGPAVICDDGSWWYIVNGQIHRLDGPAVYRTASPLLKEYYSFYIKQQFYDFHSYKKAAKLSDEDISLITLKYNLT